MEDLLKFLETNAPFLFNNWQWLLLTFIFCVTIAMILGKLKQPERPLTAQKERVQNGGARKGSLDDESPMAEFSDNLGNVEDSSQNLHSPDTPLIPYKGLNYDSEEMLKRSSDFYNFMNKRRSVREFSTDSAPNIEVISNIIRTAGTSPSGAHTEPWTFVVIKDTPTKAKVREIIEQEEYLNYSHRMGDKWVSDLKFIHTDHTKPYLEEAPYLIIVFKQQYHINDKGVRFNHYYYEISTAIACGMLVTAIHNAGLATVVTTPMNAGGQLRELLGRPANEKVMLLLPVGYPADDARVPDVGRKELDQIMVVV